MTFVILAAGMVLVVFTMLLLAAALIIRPHRLRRARTEYRTRTRAIAPYIVLLAVVLLVNNVTRRIAPEVSWLIGWNITGYIYAIEGSFVAGLQSLIPAVFAPYFAFMYVLGYVFLLVFPLIAYVSLEDLTFARKTCIAYTFNYGIGLLFYLVFVAYGPRNLLPDLVEPILFANWPASHLLASEINTNTNVFPSLHTSLSITAGLLAYQTRAYYPTWTIVAAVFAGSITLSTMYLGIHWLMDVIAGCGLAVAAVLAATRFETDSQEWYQTHLVESQLFRWLERCRRTIGSIVDSRR